MRYTTKRLRICAVALAAALTATFSILALCQEGKSFLPVEIERLQKSPFIQTSGEDSQQLAAYKEQLRLGLDAAREIADSGDSALCLYLLQRPFLYIRREENLSGEGSALRGIKEFDEAWTVTAGMLEKRSMELRGAQEGGDRPAVIRAMMQIAEEKSETYLGSGRRFAEIGNEAWGRAYIGSALAYMDFAILCAKTPVESCVEAAEFCELEPYVRKVEAELVRLFGQPEAEAAGVQSLLNEANSLADNCRQLEKAGLREGAVMEYLEVCLRLGQLQGVETATRERIQEKLDGARKRLGANGLDDSIGILFCGAARHQLKAATGGGERGGLAYAAIIADRVLPAYFEISPRGEK